MTAVLACGLLLGCETVQEAYDSKLTLEQPVDWWHQLQGGEIAAQRPPPPGVSDPYPNLGQIPARPTPTDATTRRSLLARLATQRDQTRQDAAQEPIVWPVPDAPKPPPPVPVAAIPSTPASPSPASPAPSAPAPAAPASTAAPAAPEQDSDVSKMVFEGATAAPEAARPAPRPAPDPHPPAAFAAAARTGAAPPAGSDAAHGPAALVSGPVPALPGAAPPLPALGGIPATTTAPATPRPRPSTSFTFARGSAALPRDAEAALRALVARRGGAPVAVTAGGDAASAAPGAQAAALSLALRRLYAITAALSAAGVPAGSVRPEAVALGRGGTARLVD